MPSAIGVQRSVGLVGARRLPKLRQVFLGIAFVVVMVGMVVSLVDQKAAGTIAPLGVLVGLGVAGGVIRSGASVYEGRERFAWKLIGTGLMMGSLGVLVVALHDVIAPPAPTYGPTDLIFFFTYFLLVAGFALMPHLGSMLGSRVRVLLDGSIGAASMITLIWAFFYPALEELMQSATFWERFAGVAYPVLDSMMVVVAMIVTIRRSTWRFDLRIVLFGIAMVVQAISDLSLLTTGIGESFQNAEPNFFLFLVAVSLYLTVAAVIRRKPKPREYAERRQPLWAMLAPYGASVVVVGVIVVRLQESQIESDIQLLLLIGFVLVGLVVARQAVALREYRSLVQQQRSSLVSSVSHELRTPLTAMVGFLDVLKDPRVVLEPEERNELTEVVHQQAVYMSRIVADLLLLARSSVGLQLQESEVRLDKLIPETLRSIPESQGVLDIEIEPHLVAYVDGVRLRQVVANLVVNALRYGKGRVLVSAKSLGPDLIVEVHDNGEGVPRKYELAIWEQFERGVHRLNSTVPGSGIGLAIVDMVVRAHGGMAGYERSRSLGGACFRIILPGRLRTEQPVETDVTTVRRVSA